MGILSGHALAQAFVDGDILIDPYNPAHVQPNSYDFRLGPELLVYAKNWPLHEYHRDRCTYASDLHRPEPPCVPLDMKEDECTIQIYIPSDGLVLWPGVLYLGATVERVHTSKYVPAIEGRSSVARLGVCAHVAAGWGDVGFDGHFTLEIVPVLPIRVYAGVRICQISFAEVTGPIVPYAGKYNGQTGPRRSALWRDFLS